MCYVKQLCVIFLDIIDLSGIAE